MRYIEKGEIQALDLSFVLQPQLLTIVYIERDLGGNFFFFLLKRFVCVCVCKIFKT